MSVYVLVCVIALTCDCLFQFGAEFRRFSLDRSKPGRFDEFYGLLQHVHRIPNVELLVGYADVHGDLLPINNDDNYHKAISMASPLLRLFLQRKGKRNDRPGFHKQSFDVHILAVIGALTILSLKKIKIQL